MAKTKTLFAFPNPYSFVDQFGLLAGSCPIAEPPRPQSRAPQRLSVGAISKMVPGSYDASEASGRQAGSTLQPRADYTWEFPAEMPMALVIETSLEGYYAKRDRAGDLFLCKDAEDLPLERLAEARIAALETVKAEGRKIDEKAWAKQFALDELVAEIAKAVVAKREADAKAASEEAKKKADEAKKAADAAPKKLTATEIAAKARTAALENLAVKAPQPAPAANQKSTASAPKEQ